MKHKKTRKYSSVSTGLNTLVGLGMMGATASMVNSMPSGTAKSIAGVVPGLQATALVSENLKPLKKKKGFW